MLQQTREDLMEEPNEIKTSKHSKCYVANILIRGIVTNALIGTEVDVTCLSEEFVSNNKERLQECPTLPINGVTIVGPVVEKTIRLNKQIPYMNTFNCQTH